MSTIGLLLFSHWLCPTLCDAWTAACQASLSFTISQSLLKLIESVMPSNHVIPFSCVQSFPASGSFLMSQLFASGSPSIGASVSASVLPVSVQGWFPLGLTGLISFQSKGLSRVFSSPLVWKHQFSNTQPSLWSDLTLTINWITACTSGNFKGFFSPQVLTYERGLRAKS